MPEEIKIEKSPAEKILENMATALKSQSIFDDETLQALRDLMTDGDIKKPLRVTKVIKPS